VRTLEEVSEKGIIDAGEIVQLHIPLEEFISNSADWPADKAAQIVIYCGSGHRSTMAMSILWAYGYTNVRSMSGGFAAWIEAGYPVSEYVAQ
jgi:rhodanese-related sulfurtransferase